MKATREQILASVPTVCPVCGHPTTLSADYAHLCCTNPMCEGKFSRRLELFAKMLGMRNFGPANSLLLSKKITAFHQVFTLTVQDIVSCGIGQGMAQNIFSEIASVKEVPLKNFLACLNIPKIGQATAHVIANKFKTLQAIRSLSVNAIVSSMDRVGPDLARYIVQGLAEASDEIDSLLKYVSVVDLSEESSGALALEGMTICITGTLSIDRNTWKDRIEKNGGKFASSVSKNTTCLICNQQSSSSKYKKAQELGIPIYTEEWLIDKLNR